LSASPGHDARLFFLPAMTLTLDSSGPCRCRRPFAFHDMLHISLFSGLTSPTPANKKAIPSGLTPIVKCLIAGIPAFA
jgi:hypothetical protein